MIASTVNTHITYWRAWDSVHPQSTMVVSKWLVLNPRHRKSIKKINSYKPPPKRNELPDPQCPKRKLPSGTPTPPLHTDGERLWVPTGIIAPIAMHIQPRHHRVRGEEKGERDLTDRGRLSRRPAWEATRRRGARGGWRRAGGARSPWAREDAAHGNRRGTEGGGERLSEAAGCLCLSSPFGPSAPVGRRPDPDTASN